MPKREKRFRRLFCAPLLLALLYGGAVRAEDAPAKTTEMLTLGETRVRANIYEKPGARVTFFAPHHNEQIALKAAKEAVGKQGGRLVEVESFDERGRPARRVSFTLGGKPYSLDPNRVFTADGRRCGGLSPEAGAAFELFADGLLKIIFAPGGDRLRERASRPARCSPTSGGGSSSAGIFPGRFCPRWPRPARRSTSRSSPST